MYYCELTDYQYHCLQERDQELTDQMEKMLQKMAESEAAWRKSIGEKEAAMAELTSEKEDLRKEVEQLRKSVNN